MAPIKAQLQSVLKTIGLYQRLKGSRLYDLYWMVADRKIIDERDAQVEFYRRLLEGFPKGGLIFDVGANHGHKADIFSRLGATVVAIEPDEDNQAILTQKFLKYRMRKKSVIIVGKALGNKPGFDTMWIDAPGSAKNTLCKKWVDILRRDEMRFGYALEFGKKKTVEMITMEQLVKAYGHPFFIKIDVEGYEPNVLKGMKTPVPYLSFEVNLPEFRQEGIECVHLLGELDSRGSFNYVVDCQRGLELERWVSRQQFLTVLDICADKSIEVFWRTASTRGNS